MDKCNDFGPMINNLDLINLKETLSNQIEEFGVEVTDFKNTLQVESNKLVSPLLIKNCAFCVSNCDFNL